MGLFLAAPIRIHPEWGPAWTHILSQSDQFGGGFFDDKKNRVSYSDGRLADDPSSSTDPNLTPPDDNSFFPASVDFGKFQTSLGSLKLVSPTGISLLPVRTFSGIVVRGKKCI